MPEVQPGAVPSDQTLDAIAEAIRIAGCPYHQGPFGLFNYAIYGAMEDAHVVRDFRPGSSTYGHGVFACDDPVEARRVYDEMTGRHIALAAWNAAMSSSASLVQDATVTA